MTHERTESATGQQRPPATREQAGPHDAQVGRQRSGRPTSWVAVAIIIAGFVIGGLGLVLGPTWWLFWVGAGLTVVGGIFGLATGIMEDYTTEAH